MRRAIVGLLIGILVLSGMALPAEARGRNHRHHHHHGHGDGHFLGGFLAGAGTVLILDAILTPRVVYAPPVVYQPVYYRGPVCQDVWIPGRWEVHPRQYNGFTSYYQVRVPGYWQRQCY